MDHPRPIFSAVPHLFTLALCLVALFWSLPSLAQPVPILIGEPAEVRVAVDGDHVVASRGTVEVWRLPAWGGEDTTLQVADAGACVWVQHGALVELVDREHGTALDRIALYDATPVAAVDGDRAISATTPLATFTWSYTCEAGFADRPPLWAALDRQRDWQARDEALGALTEAIGPALDVEGADPVILATQLRAYQALARQLPTNPWYGAIALRIATALGDTETTARLAASLTAGPPSAEWVRMASWIDPADPLLAEAIFEQGVVAMEAAGYVPALTSAMPAVLLMTGGPPRLDTAEARARFARRLWRLAPWAEGAHPLYAAVAAETGDPIWRDRAAQASRDGGVARWTRHGATAGLWLNLLFAGLFALALLFVVELARHERVIRRGRGLRISGIAAVRLSFAAFVASASLAPVAQGIGELGVVASMPIEVVSGSTATPGFEAYWSAAPEAPGRDVLLGIAAAARGDEDEALARYARSESDAARANAGILLATRGQVAEADALWASVDEAGDAWAVVEAWRATGAQRVATPTPWELQGLVHAEMVTRAPEQGAQSGLLRALQRLDDLVIFDAVIFAVLLIIFMARLMWWRQRPARAPRRPLSRPAWLLSAVIPGGAWRWHVWGPLVTIVVLYGLLTAWALAQTDGSATNLLDALYHAPSGPLAELPQVPPTELHRLSEQLGRRALWWTLAAWGAGLALERLWPDPRGPWGRDEERESRDSLTT